MNMNKWEFYEFSKDGRCDYGVFTLEEIKEMVEEYKKEDKIDEGVDNPPRKIRYFARNINTDEEIEL